MRPRQGIHGPIFKEEHTQIFKKFLLNFKAMMFGLRIGMETPGGFPRRCAVY